MSVSITACAFCLKNFQKILKKCLTDIYIYDIITLEKQRATAQRSTDMTEIKYPITREYAAKIAAMSDDEIHAHRYDLLKYGAAPQPFGKYDPVHRFDWWSRTAVDIYANYCTKVLMERQGKTGEKYEWIYSQKEYGACWDYLNK